MLRGIIKEALNESIRDSSWPLFQTRFYHPALSGTPPRPSFQTRLYHPHPCGREEGNWNHLGGLVPTPLYQLHPCRRASMQAYIRVGKNTQGVV